MNKATQRTKINQFLRGKKKIEVDAFGIYQWIECCHFHGWWENAIQLSSFLPPNSLNPEYHKRLDYLLKECREGFKENYVELKNPEGNKYFTIPKLFWNVCKELGIKLGKKSNIWLGLEINDSKLILIEGIEQKGCFFKFYDLRKEDLIGWLKKHDFSHLIEKIRPIKLTNRKPCWLKLTWEEATDLIPVIVDNKREICRVSKSSKAKRKKDWPKRYVQREKFWISLLEKANGQTQLHAKILSPGPYNWIATGAGKSGLGYSYVVRMYDTQVELYIDLWDYNTNLINFLNIKIK